MARIRTFDLPRRLSDLVSGPYQEDDDQPMDQFGALSCGVMMAVMFVLAVVLIASSIRASADMHRACVEEGINTTAECGEMLRGGM